MYGVWCIMYYVWCEVTSIMGRKDFLLGRSDWGRSDWERNDHGAKWPDTVGDCLAVCTNCRPMMLDFLSSILHSDDKLLSLGGIFTHLWWLVIYLSPRTHCRPVILDWLACFLHALYIFESSVKQEQFFRPMKNKIYPDYYFILENNSKQICVLIGLKPCFYSSRETQN